MSSSMLMGDRRWAPGKRGGMTVLGKVAFPKPLNLPSQRLENHGLDPNVEIVPKGTTSWGSRSSSSPPNAWASSLSLNTDGSISSPGRLSGRPLSGGSGRPSTAGSERCNEPITSAWSSNARPSSASGLLPSNQANVATLRPRSAETRPGSSQLSRFADNSSVNSTAWDSSGTAEKLGVTSSKNDEFSLTSRDFPSLGSGKENSGKKHQLQDQLPPAHEKTGNSSGNVSLNVDVMNGYANTWGDASNFHYEDGARPSVEKWNGDPHPFPNFKMHPQQLEHWRAPPAGTSPGSVWYRGPLPGPPFGPPITPVGFSMEPYPYYCSQVPPNPPPAGPRGRSKNGDMHKSHVSDAYIRPGMPMRPGFYPRPSPHDSYYTPGGYCNSGDQNIPFMAAGPAVYNRYPSHNATTADPVNYYAIPGGYTSSGRGPVYDQGHLSQPHDDQGKYDVLLRRHDGWDGKEEEQEGATTGPACKSYLDDHQRSSSSTGWKAHCNKDELMDTGSMPVSQEASSYEKTESRGSSPLPVKSSVTTSKARGYEHCGMKSAENNTSALPDVAEIPKGFTLIRKIEGLNAKARASDGRHNIPSVSGNEEQSNRFQAVYSTASHAIENDSSNAVYHERTSSIRGTFAPAEHRGIELHAAASGNPNFRRGPHDGQGGIDHSGKEVINAQDAGRYQKSLAADSGAVLQDCHTYAEASESSKSLFEGKDERESAAIMYNSDDIQAQRAKMREIAKQRAQQREKEEEERTREQKAKALAKLEELNRRTQAVEDLPKKLENASLGGPIQKNHEESRISDDLAVSQKDESIGSRGGGLSLSNEVSPHDIMNTPHESGVVGHNQPFEQQQDAYDNEAPRMAPRAHDSSVSKHEGISSKQSQIISSGKSSTENSATLAEVPKSHSDVEGGVVSETASSCEVGSSASTSAPTMPLVHQRRKNHRSGKNKPKQEASFLSTSTSLVPKGTDIDKTLVDNGMSNASELDIHLSSVQPPAGSKDLFQSSEKSSFVAREGGNPQLKSQHFRRLPRNQQGNKLTDKFQGNDTVMWAPVRTHAKSELAEEAGSKGRAEGFRTPPAKDDNLIQNLKSKRAEIERYVPKPAVKESAQHGPAFSADRTTPDEFTGKSEPISSQSDGSLQTTGPVSAKVGSTVEYRSGGGNKPNKQVKAHGSWRQKGSFGRADGSSISNLGEEVKEFIEDNPVLKLDGKRQVKTYDEWDSSDGWNASPNPDSVSSVPVLPVLRDHRITSKGKKLPNRAQRNPGNNTHESDHKNVRDRENEEIDRSSLAHRASESDRATVSKENRGASHWQPKTQGHLRTGVRPAGTQNAFAEGSRYVRKEHAESIEKSHSPNILEKEKAGELKNAGNPEVGRVKKMGSQEGHSQSMGGGSTGSGYLPPPPGIVAQPELQRYRRNGNRNGCDLETRDGWICGGQNNEHANWERQRQSSHYEYQPVGYPINHKSKSKEQPMNVRFRERGQGISRYGRKE